MSDPVERPTATFVDLDFADDLAITPELQEELERRVAKPALDLSNSLRNYAPVADDDQMRVIEASDRTIRLVAPAGSGKTQTVINRVLARVRGGLDPSRILVLTYDRSAADSLRGKLADQLAIAGAQVTFVISTLNAFGYRLLSEYARSEYKPLPSGRDERNALREVRAALKDKSPERHAVLPTNVRDNLYLELFGYLKNQVQDPRDTDPKAFLECLIKAPAAIVFFPKPEDAKLVTLAVQAVLWMFQAYDRVLQRRGVIDFDDQKLRAFKMLMNQPELLRVVQGKYDEVIVDEFQDINKLDFALITAVAARRFSLRSATMTRLFMDSEGARPTSSSTSRSISAGSMRHTSSE